MATEMLQYLDLDGLDETVLNIGEIKTNLEGQIQDLPYARPDGIYPDMTVGAVIGADETAQWATRESTGSGAATVRSVQGAAEVQNGELVPVRIAGIRSIGFNQWNEEWVAGVINPNGTTEEDTRFDRLLSKNFIPVIAGATYCISMQGSFNRGRSTFYDESYNLVEYKADFADNWTKLNSSFGTFTVPNGACYMKFCTVNDYGVIYNHDICINLSNPALNGQYKPYTTDSIEWPTQTLRAAGSVADILYSNHVDVRVGVVDMGTLNYVYANDGVFRATAPNMFAPTSYAGRLDGVQCAKYPVDTNTSLDANMTDKTLKRANGLIVIRDTDYDNVVTFKASLAGVYLFYELAKPTTQTVDPTLDMIYRVQAGGSESIIVPTGEVSAAPVLTIAEPVNAGDEFARIWAAIKSLGYTRNAAQLSRPVSLTDIGSIDEVQKDTTDIVEIDTTKEVTE